MTTTFPRTILSGHADPHLSQRLAQELADVHCRFAAELISDLPCVNTLVKHVDRYRGKMLRPTLVLVSGMAMPGGLSDAHRVTAAVVEMVHMATLVHDDVLDDANVRRQGATVNQLTGNETAVMLGDFLISHAYHLSSTLNRPEISRVLADTTNTVCEGELLQLANRNNLSLDERTYFEVIRRKTASLCGTCCRLGASLSGAPEETAERFYDYGEKLGVAFQIIDDLLDLIGDQVTVGKTLGRDLQKGKLTLPVIHLLHSLPGDQQARLLDRLGRAARPDEDPEGQIPVQVRRLILDSGSVEYTNQWAQRLVNQAKDSISAYSGSSAFGLLMEMADAVITRKF